MSTDTAKMMAYDASKKSVGAAYLLWFFLGGIGGHRFYAGRVGSGVAYLILQILGWLTVALGVGLFFLGVVALWWIIDGFLLSGIIRQKNMEIGARLSTGNWMQP